MQYERVYSSHALSPPNGATPGAGRDTVIRTFILRLQGLDEEVARKHYMTGTQAMTGFAKQARNFLGEHPSFVSMPNEMFGGYYRNARGDVLEMR